METFTNEECKVIVVAIKGLAGVVETIAKHIYGDLHEDTFQHYADAFSEGASFADRTVYQLKKIQKRLQDDEG